MDTLVRATGDFLAAILRALGFVGRPRRRAEIRADLELLDQVRKSSLGTGSQAEERLVERVEADVARLCGVAVEGDKKRPASTIFFGLFFGLPAAYWTYWLVQDGFELLALLPGAIAFFLLVGTLGVILMGTSDDS